MKQESPQYTSGFRAGFRVGYDAVRVAVQRSPAPLPVRPVDADDWRKGFDAGREVGRGAALRAVERMCVEADQPPPGLMRRAWETLQAWREQRSAA